jgi:hypothetical protein
MLVFVGARGFQNHRADPLLLRKFDLVDIVACGAGSDQKGASQRETGK